MDALFPDVFFDVRDDIDDDYLANIVNSTSESAQSLRENNK